jgi:SAM-dependent methyltransferase
MSVAAWWKQRWAFTPGDPANRLHPRKYDLLYEFEDRYWWFVGMRRIQRSLVPELYAPHRHDGFRMLDAGCGTGGRLAAIQDSGMRVGIDLSWNALAYASRRDLPWLLQAPIQQLPFRSDSFDVVLSFDVINLLEDDASAVRELKRICKPGGVAFLSLPAFNFLGGTHSQAVGMVRRYTKRSLRRLLIEAGFEVERITYTNCLLFPVVLLARGWSLLFPTKEQQHTGGFDFKRHSAIVRNAFLAMLTVESLLLRWINLPIGSSVAVRAIKR